MEKFDELTLPIGYDLEKDEFLRCSDLPSDTDFDSILKSLADDHALLKKVVIKRFEEAPFMELLSPKISTKEQALNHIKDETVIGRELIDVDKMAILLTVKHYTEQNKKQLRTIEESDQMQAKFTIDWLA